MLKQRVATSAVIFFLVFFAFWFGDPWLSILIAIAAAAGAFEFYRMNLTLGKEPPSICLGLIWTLALVLRPHYQDTGALPLVITLILVISLTWLLCQSPRQEAFRNWAWTIAGAFYLGWMLGYWIDLNTLVFGKEIVFLAILTTFINDIGAFCTGKVKGKHALAPSISPGKTWEGALGGLLSALVGAVVIFAVINSLTPLPFTYSQVLLLGCLISVFAQTGDLVESLLKRNTNIKDSGKLLPGHGGILDRLDSIIFVGPVIYYYAIWILL
jgi:phosphatidate cytidylyltransferase